MSTKTVVHTAKNVNLKQTALVDPNQFWRIIISYFVVVVLAVDEILSFSVNAVQKKFRKLNIFLS